MLISFECTRKTGKRIEQWNGIISSITKYRSHTEIRIESRSGIMVVFGRTSQGWFACIPDFKDKFWNTEKLTAVLGKVDGITVAEALYALAEKVEL